MTTRTSPSSSMSSRSMATAVVVPPRWKISSTLSLAVLGLGIFFSMLLNVLLLVLYDRSLAVPCHPDDGAITGSSSTTKTTTAAATSSSSSLAEATIVSNKPGQNKTTPLKLTTTSTRRDEQQQHTPTTTSSSSISFSACMLIKDDNAILNEWVAYHYHVMHMRYLVVAVDPSSATSPEPILERWRNETDLEYAIWEDADFMPTSFLQKGYHIPPRFVSGDAQASKWHDGSEDPEQVIADRTKINNHRFRQITFLSSCFRHLVANKKTWTFHVDTDEYVVLNPVLRRRHQQGQPLGGGAVNNNNNATADSLLRIPSVGEANSIAAVVDQINRQSDWNRAWNYPCISMPRLLYGSVENDADADPKSLAAARARTNAELSRMFRLPSFETLRWKYHSAFDDKERNAQPKVIVDVSAVPPDDEMFGRPPRKAFSIHRPSKALCRRIDQLSFYAVDKYPLTVNHYLGTWERYYARNDTRRSKRAYDFKAHVEHGRDNWIASWLGGFVKAVGRQKAKLLLSDHAVVVGAADGGGGGVLEG